jgi:GGDEF domain-containing protein
MQEMIASLTHAPAGAGGNGGHAGSPVLKIAAGLETAAGEKASALKEHLPESLDGVEEDANRQEAESDQMVQLPARNLGIDPVTGLPWEGAAQAHFLAAIRNGEQKHVVVFVLGSAQRINLRFGRAAGDQVIRALKEHLAGQLDSGDRMFRWPGPAIVALLATSDPFDRVRTRLKRVLDKHIEREFDINGRSVLIPLTTAWSVFALSIPLAVPSRQIHDFIAGQGYREEDPIPA